MIAQFKVLLKVKQLREDKALRELQKKRSEVRAAEEKITTLTAEVAESKRMLPIREAELYDTILNQVVGLVDVDGVKERVHGLLQDHQLIVDRLDRARHVLKRLEEELVAVKAAYQKALREKDKFTMMTEELEAEAAAEATAKEETEIEDLFSKSRTMVAS